MRLVISDIETDSLEPLKHIWLFGGIDYDTRERFQFNNILHIPEEREKAIEWAKSVDTWVFHYGLGFDVPVINNYLGFELIDPTKVVDTVVVSQLVDFDIDGGHSLEAWGKRLGKTQKGKFKDFANFSQEMVDYWNDDLNVTLEVYEHFLPIIADPKWKKSLDVEHAIAWECRLIHEAGFDFNKDEAGVILGEVTERMSVLEEQFQKDFPPVLVEIKRLQYKTYKDSGLPHVAVQRAIDTYPKTEVVDGELICYDYRPFSPGSSQQRVDRLWEAGWKPFEKTKTHNEYVRDRKRVMNKGMKNA